MIPFLRGVHKQSPTSRRTINGGSHSHSVRKSITAEKGHRSMRKKELGWNSYVKPISFYNEKVHMSMKIPFDRI